MLLARLYPYDPIADTAGSGVLLRLSDEDLKTILDGLEVTSSGRLLVRLLAEKEDGESVEVQMSWQTEIAGFSCSLADKSVGVLTHDELAGAIGKPLPEHHRTCRVCLSAELDIWRCGVVDVERGLVHVYTRREGLATVGAHVFFTDADKSPSESGFCFDLTAGEPAKGALRVPSSALRAIQGRAGPVYDEAASASEAFGRLSELSSSVAEFQRNVRSNGLKF
ncbi:MAG: hypothetical protein ITG07_02005 [Candidimonas sp.]|nr:hypothetical protein [Candidimonas sp.]